MRRLTTSLSPNAERDDVRLAFRTLFQPWRWKSGSAIADLEHSVGAFFRGDAYTFESGRSALVAVIQALDIPPQSEILLQAFTCVAVPNSIRWAGAVPVYADVNPETFTLDVSTLEALITPRTRAILVQHTFGIPADMEAIMRFAKEHKLFVIEDCAHSFGSRWKGQLLGTFGEAAIFSFGRDKALSSVFGGIALTRHTTIAKRLRDIHAQTPLPSYHWIAQQLFHPLVLALALFFYDTLSIGKLVLEIAKRFHLISKAVESTERRGTRPAWTEKRMPNALATLALHQWKKRERFDAHRRRIADIYRSSLDSARVSFPALSPHADPALLRFPVRTPRRDMIFAAARKARIQLGDWYTSPLAPDGVDERAVNYTRGMTPHAEQLAQDTLNLPTHIHISEADAHRIVVVVHQVI